MKDEDKVYPRWLIRRVTEKYWISRTGNERIPTWEIVYLRWPLAAGYKGYSSAYASSFEEACAKYAEEANKRKAGHGFRR